MKVFLARHVIPVSTRPIADGALATEAGRIVHVGPRDEVLGRAGDGAEVIDLGQVALMPGLVNAHVHVELSWLGDEPFSADDFVGWVRELIARRENEDPDRAREAASLAIETMVSRGTAAIGDVANATWVAPLLADSPLRGVLFHEVYSPRADEAEAVLVAAEQRISRLAADPAFGGADGRWKVVITPHAPHTTSAALLHAIARRSAASSDPLSIHAAESPAETALLADGTGPFAELFRLRNVADAGWSPPGLSSIEYLDRNELLGPRTLAVHCVQLRRTDHGRLQTRGSTVVTCPRSNAMLGVGRAPVPELLAEGVPVALGTDSLASAPDLDLFAEMAALLREHPTLSPAAAVRMATWNGARALGLGAELGSLEPGKSDRLLVVPLTDETTEPLAAICSEPREVRWLSGILSGS